MAPQTAGIRAKALTHATAKWDWLAAAAGPGSHVLRLSYGRRDGSAPGGHGAVRRESDRAALLDTALQDASALLTVPVTG